MGSYIMNFAVYTMAMCGLIFFALFVYKKFATGSFTSKNSQFLNVEDTLSIGPRKVLYVIRAGREKFLVASDADKTTLISKLENYETIHTASGFERELQAAAKSTYTPQNYERRSVNIQSPKPQQKQEVSAPAQPDRTVFAGIDELPDIKALSKNKKTNNNVLKSMVNKVKVKE